MSAHGGESPTVSVSIRTGPGEDAHAAQLAARLDGAPVRICPTGAAAWRPWTRRATHHLVLDAAVRPHPHLLAQVQEAVAAQPRAVLRLFTRSDGYASHASRVAAFSGCSWFVPPGPDPSSVAVVLPVPEAAEFARSVPGGDLEPVGLLLQRFAAEQGLSLLASTADLVQLEGAGAHAPATAFLSAAMAPAD